MLKSYIMKYTTSVRHCTPYRTFDQIDPPIHADAMSDVKFFFYFVANVYYANRITVRRKPLRRISTTSRPASTKIIPWLSTLYLWAYDSRTSAELRVNKLVNYRTMADLWQSKGQVCKNRRRKSRLCEN